MAAPKAYPYAIYYTDGSYMIYDITQKDFEMLQNAVLNNYGVAAISIGLIATKDVRSVIKQNPPKEEKKPESATPMLTAEEIEWLAMQKASWTEGEPTNEH